MITQEQIFQLKQQLEQQTYELQKELLEVQKQQEETTRIDKLAELVLKYESVQNEISDRGQLFAFFSSPDAYIASPYQKAELFSIIECAETIGSQLVDVVADQILEHLRIDIQSGEDDSVDLIQAEFKEYILPAKIIAERFDQIDALIDEMNRYCRVVDANYADELARSVIVYAFEASLSADIGLEPTIHAIREMAFAHLTPEDRATLLDRVEERLAVLRYETTKNQNIAMDKAIEMMEQREKK